MNKVRWGVLGTADIARGATIPGMIQAEHCELCAIAGRKAEKAAEYQRTFGFQKAYGSYEELLADPEVEAVYIPLPNDLHCEWTLKALQAHKHVLCEKPMAVSERQAAEMFRMAEENGMYLMEAYAYLHSPIIKAIKAELDAGTVGDVRYLESSFIGGLRPDTDIRLRRETYGGSLYDLGCYTVSMALWLMEKEPDTVHATAQFSDKRIDLFTSALLAYENGAMVNLNCGMALPQGRLDRFHLCGTQGEIASPVAFNQSGEIPYTVIRNGVKETKTVTAPSNYMLEIEQLSLCVLGEARPHVTREFSLKVARVMDRILKEIGY